MKSAVSVLFVDDDEIFLKVLSKYFQIRHPACQVQTCHSGEECLVILKNFQPDLVVMDYHLQRKEGSVQGGDLIRAIRAAGSPAKLVVLSGRERYQMMPELLQENVEDYIVKDMDALAELDKILVKYF